MHSGRIWKWQTPLGSKCVQLTLCWILWSLIWVKMFVLRMLHHLCYSLFFHAGSYHPRRWFHVSTLRFQHRCCSLDSVSISRSPTQATKKVNKLCERHWLIQHIPETNPVIPPWHKPFWALSFQVAVWIMLGDTKLFGQLVSTVIDRDLSCIYGNPLPKKTQLPLKKT